MILFGSRARGDASPRADVDVAVECPSADARRWSDLEEAAENAHHLLQIDLVRLDRAPADLAAVVRAEARCSRTPLALGDGVMLARKRRPANEKRRCFHRRPLVSANSA